MSAATKMQKQRVTEVVVTRVTALERLAIQQAAEASNTTVSRIARAAIIRGLNKKAE